MSVTEICSWTMVGEEGKGRLGGPSASGSWGSSTIRGLDLCLFPPLRGSLLGPGPAFSQDAGPSCGGWNRGLEDRRPPFVPPGLTLACPSPGGVLLSPACLLLLFSGGSLLRRSSGFSARVYCGYFGHGKAGCAQSGGDIFVGGAGGAYAVDPWERASLEMGKPSY